MEAMCFGWGGWAVKEGSEQMLQEQWIVEEGNGKGEHMRQTFVQILHLGPSRYHFNQRSPPPAVLISAHQPS